MIALDLNNFYNTINKMGGIIEPQQEPKGLYSVSKRLSLADEKDMVYSDENRTPIMLNSLSLEYDILHRETEEVIATSQQLLNGYVSTRPSLPVTPALVLTYLIDIEQLSRSAVKHLYFKDDLNMNTTPLISVDETTDPLEIIQSFYPMVSNRTLRDIYDYYMDMFANTIRPYMKDNTSLYTVDISGFHTVISSTNIYEYRYKLMIRNKDCSVNPDLCFDKTIDSYIPSDRTHVYHYVEMDDFLNGIMSNNNVGIDIGFLRYVIYYINGLFYILDKRYSVTQITEDERKGELLNIINGINTNLQNRGFLKFIQT